jgi:hypothetical protein
VASPRRRRGRRRRLVAACSQASPAGDRPTRRSQRSFGWSRTRGRAEVSRKPREKAETPRTSATSLAFRDEVARRPRCALRTRATAGESLENREKKPRRKTLRPPSRLSRESRATPPETRRECEPPRASLSKTERKSRDAKHLRHFLAFRDKGVGRRLPTVTTSHPQSMASPSSGAASARRRSCTPRPPRRERSHRTAPAAGARPLHGDASRSGLYLDRVIRRPMDSPT